MGDRAGMDGLDRRWHMPVTKDQAQMLATLAIACRPSGAPRWDAGGVMAALAKVRHLSLADVTLATIRAADDRELHTPGAIGNPTAKCWDERKTDRSPSRHEWADDAHRCRICSLPRAECERVWQEHDFEPATEAGTYDMAATIQALRQAKAEEPTDA